MRTAFILPIISMVFIFTSCANEPLDSDLDPTVITIDENDYKNVLNTSEIIDTSTVGLIALESKNGIIGTVDKLVVTDSAFIILDKTTQKVWIFNISGEYINAIEAHGRGPNEYSRIHTITYKEPNLIGILDDSQKRLLWFSLQGKFIEKHEIHYYACDVYAESSALHLMYRYIPENAPSHENYYYHKKYLDSDSSEHALPYYPFGLFFTVDDPFFIVNDSELLIRNPFDNGLYTYQDGVLAMKYALNFSKPKVPYDSDGYKGSPESLSREIQSGDYQGNISQVAFTSANLSMRYTEYQKEGGAEVVHIVYDITDKGLKVFSGVTVEDDFEIYYQHPIASYKDQFFSVLHPYSLQAKTIERIGNIGDVQMANPVIMSFKYSEN